MFELIVLEGSTCLWFYRVQKLLRETQMVNVGFYGMKVNATREFHTAKKKSLLWNEG